MVGNRAREMMNGRQRVLAFLNQQPVDHLPLMPVVMMFCADHIGVKYGEYVKDHRTLAEAQIRTAEDYDFDIVSNMSDPAREAADCGAHIEFYEDQPAAIIESDALLADKTVLATLEIPDPLGGGRMHEAVKALEVMKQRVGDEKAIMGWVEGPCAEAADLRGINTLMIDLYDDPAFVRDLFEFTLRNGTSLWQGTDRCRGRHHWRRRRGRFLDRPQALRAVCLAVRETAGRWFAGDGREGAASHLWKHQNDRRWHGTPGLRYRRPGLLHTG